jgi:type II secretory pathway component PulK
LKELEEAGEEPEPLPGLSRFLTMHSDGLININTAPVEVLRCLFPDESQWDLADAIVEYRSGQASDYEEDPEAEEDDESDWKPFKSIQDLTKVDGITNKVLQDASIDSNSVTMASNVFSITIFATRDNLTLQYRAIVKRHGKGFRTLLFEERKDPRVEPPPDEEDEEG